MSEQLLSTLRAIQYPASIPASAASLNLITENSNTFVWSLMNMFGNTDSLGENLAAVRRIYEINSIPNQIVDGTVPYPENSSSLLTGISVEFRYVLNLKLSLGSSY